MNVREETKTMFDRALAEAFCAGVFWERGKPGFQMVDDKELQRETFNRYHAFASHVDGSDWRDDLRYLLTWTPECTPIQFSESNPYYVAGDGAAPFFSEAYLYTLLGKEDARSLLYPFNRMIERMGIDRHEILERPDTDT